MILFLITMNKTLDKISSQTRSLNAKNLLKENLDNLSKQEDFKTIDHNLKKAFQNLIRSGAIEKLKQTGNHENEDTVNLFLLAVISDLMEQNQNFPSIFD